MKPVPTLLENCQRFYDALDERAVTTEDGTRVFRGHTTTLMSALDPPIAQSHYTWIRRHLIAMDCVRKVQSGSRFSESVWILITRPTQDLLAIADPGMLTQGRNGNSQLAVLKQTISDVQTQLETQLGGLNVAKAMKNFETRITELETEVQTLKEKQTDGEVN